MYAGRHYSLIEVMFWTRRETAIFVAIATVPTLLFPLAGWTCRGAMAADRAGRHGGGVHHGF